MPSADYIFNIIGLVLTVTIIALSLALVSKMQKVKDLLASIERLKRSLDEMDEQAKLIVRTDMELNKTQEELDKKMDGLYALQRLSRTISTSLEENQLLSRVNADNLAELGLEKALAFIWNEASREFSLRLCVGYTDDETREIKRFLQPHQLALRKLIAQGATISSLNPPQENIEIADLKRAFAIASFIISPLLPKEGDKGFLFVGTQNADTDITEGDEELINILTNQLGQALENARLFEKTWKAQQELEKKVEERTRELSRVLEEVKIISKRKTDFVSSVSHELRTPLTSIKGYAAILLAGKLGEVPEGIRQRLDKINQHSDELVHMVNDLLDISRIEAGRLVMKQEPVELKTIAEKIGDLLGVQLKAKQISLTLGIASDANKVWADKNQLERVFINLVGNALKFTPEKGTINISSHSIDETTVQVDVSDTGCGIPPDMHEKIFEEFYRVENAINDEVKGTGLGLALVKHIVVAHKGKIWVTSIEGKGTTFSLTFPKPA